MTRKPSADPYNLIIGRGTTGGKENYVSNHELKDKQTWIVESSSGEIVDIHQWDEDHERWDSLLGEYVRSVSGLHPDSDNNIDQLVEVNGPSPEEDGREPQFGYDYDRQEIFVYADGGWKFLGSVGSTEGATRTHELDPSKKQVNDPSDSITVSETGSSGSVDSGNHIWAVTFVAPWGETTLGSSHSGVLDVSDGEVELTGIPTGSEAVVDNRFIYRTKADTGTDPGDAAFYYVDDIGDNSSTSYIDSTADSALGETSPSSNNTEAHSGTLPETFVSFDDFEGHNHDGNNSNEAIVQPHDIAGDKHTGGLPWSELENIPSNFTPDSHDVDPTSGPHTGNFPWSRLENVPSLASNPHTNEAHENDFALDPHSNDQHSETYLTSAVERIRYGAGQLGNISQLERLQPPVPIDVAGTAVKAYALAKNPPSDDVSATITVKDSEHGTYFEYVITLSSGSEIETDTSMDGQTIYDESVISFSLNDSDPQGQDFGVYLIVETEIGS